MIWVGMLIGLVAGVVITVCWFEKASDMKVELWKSADGWRVRLKGRNGRILLDSEAYSSKTKASQTAGKVAAELKTKVVEREASK